MKKLNRSSRFLGKLDEYRASALSKTNRDLLSIIELFKIIK